jgi:hypothetical protein
VPSFLYLFHDGTPLIRHTYVIHVKDVSVCDHHLAMSIVDDRRIVWRSICSELSWSSASSDYKEQRLYFNVISLFSTSHIGLVVKSNVAIVGPRVRFTDVTNFFYFALNNAPVINIHVGTQTKTS